MNNSTRRRLRALVQDAWQATQLAARLVALLGCLLAALPRSSAAAEQVVADDGQGARIVLRNTHFVLHTDVARPAAEAMLERMEAALKAAAKYWQREPRNQIVCYVVADLEQWPDSALPHPLARIWIGGVGGATISEYTGAGRQTRVRATVYAIPRPGVVEHEVIHAYCYQTFGEAGPDWYKEGMAQLVAHGSDAGGQTGCQAALVRPLAGGKSCSVQEVVQAGRFTVQMHDSCGVMLAQRSDRQRHVPLSDWKAGDAELVRAAEQHYIRSWALCHLLLHNPNYAAGFRALGVSYVTRGRDSFDSAFAPVAKEMTFEYAFFLAHLDVGYRVDLCRWDWEKRFLPLSAGQTLGVGVEAARGYQASGLTVVAGQGYQYSTVGVWGTSAAGPTTNADGDGQGAGRLEAVVMRDYGLDAPFELGVQGAFVAATSGNLFIRCRDAWNGLHDNHGSIHVRFQMPIP